MLVSYVDKKKSVERYPQSNEDVFLDKMLRSIFSFSNLKTDRNRRRVFQRFWETS